MKKYLFISLGLLLLSGCTLFTPPLVIKTFDKNETLKTLDFQFKCGEGPYDERENCTLKTFHKIVNGNENSKYPREQYAILLEMPKLNGKNRKYWAQSKELNKAHGNYIMITSERVEYFYFMTQKVLDKLQSDYKGFRITIIRISDQKVIFRSKHVISAKEIEKLIK